MDVQFFSNVKHGRPYFCALSKTWTSRLSENVKHGRPCFIKYGVHVLHTPSKIESIFYNLAFHRPCFSKHRPSFCKFVHVFLKIVHVFCKIVQVFRKNRPIVQHPCITTSPLHPVKCLSIVFEEDCILIMWFEKFL